MTKKEILKNFPIPTKFGVCENCAYVDLCTNILPGLNKPNKCGGPFKIIIKSSFVIEI